MAQGPNATTYTERLKGIDTLVNRVMTDWKIAGLSIGVVYKDQLIFAKGYGYRDVEQKLPVTPNTVFAIASCTKAFTGMLVGMAQDRKQLDITKPVNQYLPRLEFYTPQLTALITPKDMLTHRTGLPRHDWVTHAKPYLPVDTVIRRIRYLEPSKGIREEVQYNNLMYTALGRLTEEVSGKSWSEQLREYIFKPLDMTTASPAFADLVQSAEYSRGYVFREGAFIAGNPSTEGENAAGSINASVTDMSKWLIAWINDGKYKGKQVLPAGFARQAATPQMSTPSRPNPAVPAYPDAFFGDMGYGWVIDSYRGHYHVQHSGDLPLYSSNTAFFPTDSIGIIVLVNKFNATMPELISSSIADRLFGLPYKDWNGLLLSLHQKRNPAPVPTAATISPVPAALPRPAAAYVGEYQHGGYGVISIILEGDKLMAAHNGQTFAFAPESGDHFKANVPGGKLTVIADKEGRVTALTGKFEQGIADIVFRRK